MTTFGRTNVKCANCGENSEQLTLTSIYSSGGNELDLRPTDFWRGTMKTWLQDCPGCGMVAPDLESLEGDITPVLNSDGFKELMAFEDPPKTERYYQGMLGIFLRGSYIAEAQEDLGEAAMRALHTAWIADDMGISAIEYRSKAADLLMASDAETPESKLRLIDMLRRAERWEEAQCDVVTLLEWDIPDNLRKIASFQLKLIDDLDAKAHSVQEAFENG